MKLSLYEISQEHLKLVEALIESDGELSPELEASLTVNKQDLETKGVNYGLIIKQVQGECEIIDKEIERLTALKKARINSIDRLKNNLSSAMELFQVEKIESPVLKISFRKSESVEIQNESQIEAKFINTKTVTTIDKTAIKEAIKKGEPVAGAILKQNKNIQFK
jgi:hypothetical protein